MNALVLHHSSAKVHVEDLSLFHLRAEAVSVRPSIRDSRRIPPPQHSLSSSWPRRANRRPSLVGATILPAAYSQIFAEFIVAIIAAARSCKPPRQRGDPPHLLSACSFFLRISFGGRDGKEAPMTMPEPASLTDQVFQKAQLERYARCGRG
jgi:hypothetical protein